MKNRLALVVMLCVLAACVPAGGTRLEITQTIPTPTADYVQATEVRESIPPTVEPTLPPMDSAAADFLIQERCSICHSLERVNNASKSLNDWKTTIQRIVQHGAILTAGEEAGLAAHLAATQP